MHSGGGSGRLASGQIGRDKEEEGRRIGWRGKKGGGRRSRRAGEERRGCNSVCGRRVRLR